MNKSRTALLFAFCVLAYLSTFTVAATVPRPNIVVNAFSEIRVNVNGVAHLKPEWLPERETGIIEEILLENRFRNPQESYSVWDHVIYNLATREPNLEVVLNTQATEAILDGETIRSAVCWQLTTETEITVKARMFVDCSGDGLLAATAGALYRTGREAASEFSEQYAPKKADGWQMGASILLHGKDMGRPIAHTPPSFATAYDPSQANDRKIGSFLDGYWWVELGSEYDIIADQEMNRKTWEHLDLYYRTVGLGANTIINLPPDTRGLVPDDIVAAAKVFGDEIRNRFSNPIAKTEGVEEGNLK